MKKINRIYLTTAEIEEQYGYNIYDQYINMCYKQALDYNKKSKQDFKDILQEAFIAVIEAHTFFQPDREMKISSFVQKTIIERLYKFTIMNHDIIHIPYVNKYWEKHGYNKIKVDKYDKLITEDLKSGLINENEYDALLERYKIDNAINKKHQYFESEIINEEKGITFDTFIHDNTEEEQEHGILDIIEDIHYNNGIELHELEDIKLFLNGEIKSLNKNIKATIEKIKKYLKDNDLDDLF